MSPGMEKDSTNSGGHGAAVGVHPGDSTPKPGASSTLKPNPWKGQGKTINILESVKGIMGKGAEKNEATSGKPTQAPTVILKTAHDFLTDHTPKRRSILRQWPLFHDTLFAQDERVALSPTSSSGSSSESSSGSTDATSTGSTDGDTANGSSNSSTKPSENATTSNVISILRPRYIPPASLLPGFHIPGTPSLEWGESLFHFYIVNKYPGVRNVLTYSTSSELAAWLRDCERRCGPVAQGDAPGNAKGEQNIDVAKREMIYKGVEADKRIASQELDDARRERKPRLVMEDSRKEVWKWEYENHWGEEWVKPFASYPPLSSPAKTSSSSNERLSKPPPALHNRIPFHRLPRNLVVHDPWGIVGAGQDDLTEVVEKGLKEGGLVWPEPPENMVDANGDGRGETVAMRVEDDTKEGKKEKEGGQSEGVKEAAVNRIETMKSEIGEAEDNAMDIDKEEAGENAAIVEDTMEDTSQMSVDSPCSNSGTEINTKSPRPPTLKDMLHHYKLSLSSAGRAKVEFERAALERTKAEVRELVQTFRSNPRTQTLKPLLDYFDVVDDHSTSEGGMKARRVERISKTQNGVYGTPGMKHWDSAVTQPTGECRVAGYKHARWTRFGILIDPKELYYDAKGKPWVYAMWKMPPWLEGADPRFDGDGDVEEMASEGKENEGNKAEDETAHFYLSPTAYIGSGNHSLVYSVEWDLPRSTIFDGRHVQKGKQRAKTGSEMRFEHNVHVAVKDGWGEFVPKELQSIVSPSKAEGKKVSKTHDHHSAEQPTSLKGETVWTPIPLGDEAFYVPTTQDISLGDEEWFVCSPCVVERVRDIMRERSLAGVVSDAKSSDGSKEELGAYFEFVEPAQVPVTCGVGAEIKYILDPGRPEKKWTEYVGPLEIIDVFEKGEEPRGEDREEDWVDVDEDEEDAKFRSFRAQYKVTHVGWQSVRDPKCHHSLEIRFERAKRWEGWMAVMDAAEREANARREEGVLEEREKATKNGNPNRNRYGEVESKPLPGIGGKDQVQQRFWFNSVPPSFPGSSNPTPDVDDSGTNRMLKQQQDRVRFRAMAKLSKEGDHHLPRERENYESFPGHWYERWTGLILVPPLHDPVPCGPVVPQYYGYYVPTASIEGTMAGGYRSPIMLLEDCGKQVVIRQLNDADRDECASLFFRMHEDCWVHNSPFERNVMVDEEEVLVISHVDEKGAKRENLFRSNGMVHTSHWAPPPPTPKSFPRTKGHGVKTMSCGYVEGCEVVKHVMKTFRLIDFGRSVLTDVERDGDGLCTKEGDLVVAGFKVGGRR